MTRSHTPAGRVIGRLRANFAFGTGVARPALILVWLAGGAVIGITGLRMGHPEIGSSSGVVSSVDRQPPDGLRLTLDTSSREFYWDDDLLHNEPDTAGVLLPDVRVGDRLEMLTDSGMNDWVEAIQSPRGTWFSYYSESVRPYTARTWWLHELVRFGLLTTAAACLLVGLVSLGNWIPRRSNRPVPAHSAPATAAARPETPPSAHSEVAPGVPDGLRQAMGVGGLSLLSAVLLEAITLGAAGAACTAPKQGWELVVLLLMPIALLAGGIATLVLGARAARGTPAGEVVAGPRALGVVCLAAAVVGGGINLYTVASWAFCF